MAATQHEKHCEHWTVIKRQTISNMKVCLVACHINLQQIYTHTQQICLHCLNNAASTYSHCLAFSTHGDR